MKRKVALISAVVAVGALVAVGASLAFFTGTDTATNTITTGYVNVDVVEPKPVPGPDDSWTAEQPETNGDINYGNVLPGSVIDKAPTVIYKGTSAGYVRYKVVMEGLPTGVTADQIRFLNADGTEAGIVLDQYVYPTRTFTKDEKVVDPVFAQVEFSDAIGNQLQNMSTLKIKVVADTIQADNTGLGANPTVAELEQLFNNTAILPASPATANN